MQFPSRVSAHVCKINNYYCELLLSNCPWALTRETMVIICDVVFTVFVGEIVRIVYFLCSQNTSRSTLDKVERCHSMFKELTHFSRESSDVSRHCMIATMNLSNGDAGGNL